MRIKLASQNNIGMLRHNFFREAVIEWHPFYFPGNRRPHRIGGQITERDHSLMGYQLALNSEANRGSVFRVLLPAFTQQEIGTGTTVVDGQAGNENSGH